MGEKGRVSSRDAKEGIVGGDDHGERGIRSNEIAATSSRTDSVEGTSTRKKEGSEESWSNR